MIDLKKVLTVDALISFFFAAAVALLPALFGLVLGGLGGFLMVGGAVFIFVFIFLFIMFGLVGVVWSLIPRNIQFVIIVLLLAAGVLLFQPELDMLAMAGTIFTFAGVRPRLRKG